MGGAALNRAAFFSNRAVVLGLAVLCCLLWGSAYPAIKNGFALFGIVPQDIAGKLVFAGWRFTFSGLLLLGLVLVMNPSGLRLSLRDTGELTLLGLTQTGLQYGFFYVGLAYTTGVKGSILNATSTFFSALLAHALYRNDRLSINRVLGCVIGFAGVVIANFNRDLQDFEFTFMGDGFVVITAFIFSAAAIYGKRISQRMDSMAMTGYQLTIGGVALTVVGSIYGGTLQNFTLISTSLLIYLVLVSSATFSLWSLLLKYNRVGVVTVYSFLIPVFGGMSSALFLNESILDLRNATALIAVCYGIWLVTREKPAAQQEVAAPAMAGKR